MSAPNDNDPGSRIVALVANAPEWRGEPEHEPPRPATPALPASPMLPDLGRDHVDRLEAAAACLMNDTGNARRMMIWFGHDLLFVRDVGWHVWTGQVWNAVGAKEAVLRLAQLTAVAVATEAGVLRLTEEEARRVEAGALAASMPKDDRGEREKALVEARMEALTAWGKRCAARRKFSISCGNGARIAQMELQAAPHLTVGVDAMDADPYLFNVENGTLEFFRAPDPDCPDPDVVRLIWDVRLRPHARADRIAKMAPAAYDPDARAPRLMAFLDRFQPSREVQRFLQVYYGYSLLGVIGAQKLVFHYGEGANGKSTFIEMLARLMGPYARSLNPESLTGTQVRHGAQASPDLAQLPGARMVRVSEMPRGEALREALVKSLTGGEPMMVRHLNANFFEFRPSFKASMSGNDKPRIDGVDHGIWRRIALVVWGVTIADGERREMEDVLAEFAAERAGILNWMVEGALIYLREGLVEPEAIREATKAYRADMDQVQGFVDACINRAPETASVASRVVYEGYVSWCLANAMKPWSEKAFSMTLVKKGFRKEDGRIRTFHGLELHDVPPRPEQGGYQGDER